jgi:hypothetical protein
MTPAELVPYFMVGHILLVAEFRGGKLETVGYVDKTTGDAISRLCLSFAVERQGFAGPVLLQRYFPSNVAQEETEITLEKGRLYVFPLEAIERRREILVGRMAAKKPMMIEEEGQRP